MSLKELTVKYTGIYRCPDYIKNFKIKIKIKETTEEPNKTHDEKLYQKVFSWQRKYFSKFEKEFYSEEINCLTEVEKQYHNRIKGSDENNGGNYVLFSYIEGDQFSPQQERQYLKQKRSLIQPSSYLKRLLKPSCWPANWEQPVSNCETANYLAASLTNLNLKTGYRLSDSDYNFHDSLQNSLDNPLIHRNFEQMFLMADLGEYVEEAWIKNEQVLCTLKYDKISKTLQIYPDFTTSVPYHMQVDGEKTKHYFYFIENASEKQPESFRINENELIDKINHQKLTMKKQKIGNKFELPPKNKLLVFVFFEILSGSGFEYSDLFVQYFIDLPEKWFCKELRQLRGTTQICKSSREDGLVHFNHCFEFVLEYNLQHLGRNELPNSPCIYFEIFSKDNWDRHRTEGLCYKSIPIFSNGLHLQKLQCFRLGSRSSKGELRRFFIGDCQNYDDVTWIGCPKDLTSNLINKFGINTASTGELNIRMNILHQSQAFLDDFNENATTNVREKMIFEKLNSSSLIRSVEQVLQAFKKARKDMMEARKNM